MAPSNFEARGAAPLPGETAFWPVSWSAVWVGALTALAVALIMGLIGLAAGAQMVRHGDQVTNYRGSVHFVGIVWAVCSAFFSFVAGGWVAGKIVGHPRSEPAMLHGAITWLIAVPLFILMIALGAGDYFGTWYAGLSGTPAWVVHTPVVNVDEAYRIARNQALGALTALSWGWSAASSAAGWPPASRCPCSTTAPVARGCSRAAPRPPARERSRQNSYPSRRFS